MQKFGKQKWLKTFPLKHKCPKYFFVFGLNRHLKVSNLWNKGKMRVTYFETMLVLCFSIMKRDKNDRKCNVLSHLYFLFQFYTYQSMTLFILFWYFIKIPSSKNFSRWCDALIYCEKMFVIPITSTDDRATQKIQRQIYNNIPCFL